MTVLMLNGVLMGADEATIPATDRALTHGVGLYETLKLVAGVPVFFEEHIARLDLGLAGLTRRLAAPSHVPARPPRALVAAGPPPGPLEAELGEPQVQAGDVFLE